jgi:hypothetical protein
MSDGMNPRNFMWGSIVAIVLIIVIYALMSGRGIQEVVILDKLRIKIDDQVKGNTEYYHPAENIPALPGTTSSTYALNVPGEGVLLFNHIDRFVIEPGADDAQNRHLPLVLKALDTGRKDVLYKERDELGFFSVWLTTSERRGNKPCVNYRTLLSEDDGSKEAAFRTACKEGNQWIARISPELLELVGSSTENQGTLVDSQSEILSIGTMRKCLKLRKSDLTRGLLSPQQLINNCFVSVPITTEEFAQAKHGELLLGKQLKLTMEAAYDLAEFGYELYKDGEYIGSRIVFEALTLFNHADAYFHNMVGANSMALKKWEEALKNLNYAIKNDPEHVHALLNRGETLLILDRHAEALTDLKAVIRLDTQSDTPSAKRARWIIQNHY